MVEVDQEILNWLTNCPAGDGNFKSQLKNASEATIEAAIKELTGTVGKAVVLKDLKSRLHQLQSQSVQTNNHHNGVLKMDVATYEAGREEEKQRSVEQTDRESRIAQCHEGIGRIQAAGAFRKLATVAEIVWLRDQKEMKVYRDLPNIGTWDKFCIYLKKDRRTVDEDIQNLATFGEDFLETSRQLSIGYRELRTLRQLTHDGSVIIDGDCLVIDTESIPIDQDHAEELQTAIERILTDRQEINKRLTRLEKDFKGAVKEETLSFHSKEKVLLKEIDRLKVFDPEDVDDSRFEGQYETIRETVTTLATQIGKLVMMEGLHENPLAAAKVEGHIASAERLVEDLRRDWTAKFQIF